MTRKFGLCWARQWLSRTHGGLPQTHFRTHHDKPSANLVRLCSNRPDHARNGPIVGRCQLPGACSGLFQAPSVPLPLAAHHACLICQLRNLSHSHVSQERYYCESPEENTHSDALSLVDNIIASLSPRKQKTYAADREDLVELAAFLLRLKVSSHDLVKLLQETPSLLKYDVQQAMDRIQMLREEGFMPQDIPVLLHSYPEIIEVTKTVVLDGLELMRNFGFKEGRLQKLLAKHPSLFFITSQQLSNRYKELMTLFRKSDIMSCAYNMPNILTCSWEDIEEKVVYVDQVMGLHQGHVVRCNLLSHSLLHVKTRYLFLARAGLYEVPDKHGVTQIENPTLARIVDTPDDVFARKVARMSEDEFEAFKLVIAQEQEPVDPDMLVSEDNPTDSDDEHELR